MSRSIILIIIAAFALSGCGEDNPQTNDPAGNSHFAGKYALILEPPGGGTPIDSIIFDIFNNGNISNTTITTVDINNHPITALFSGTVTNDTLVNFSSNLSYMNTNFTNVITGRMIDSSGYRYLHGAIKLLNVDIGYFSFYLPIYPQVYGSFNTPALSYWFRLRKL